MKKATKKLGKPGPKKYGPKFLRLAEKLASRGALDKEIYESIGISADTFYIWKRNHPEFEYAIQDARLPSLNDIEAAMYKRAMGYEYEEVTTETTVVGDTTLPEKKTKVAKKQVAPSETAQKFILSNRRRARWSEKIEAEVTGGLSIEIGLPESLGGSGPSESEEPDSE